jgi:hypothetical protein
MALLFQLTATAIGAAALRTMRAARFMPGGAQTGIAKASAIKKIANRCLRDNLVFMLNCFPFYGNRSG